ncbi:MAG: DnaA family protein [Cellvibrionaceae bacterium]|jgi:DnaA family protein
MLFHVVKQLPLCISLERSASFSNTYVSEANRSLVDYLQKLSPHSDADSFFLWGSQGSGVTHLLEAIQNQQSQRAIQYLPLGMLANCQPESVVEDVEKMDLVCIDDVQSIAGSAVWERHLFHLFNRLKDAGKPLIIGSHLPIRQLALQLPDLKSRFQSLALYQLHSLTEAEKIQLLQYRAKKQGLLLPNEVAQFLMQRVSRSSGHLIHMLETLDRESLSAQRRLTIPFVKTVLDL